MKKGLFLPAVGSVLMFVVLRTQGAPLKTLLSPRGIIDLEFADTPARLTALLAQWNLHVVTLNIWLDFLFIIAYTLFLSFASIRCAEKWPPASMPAKAGLFFARLAYLAGLFDIAENIFMLRSVAGYFTATSLQITVYCASAKFIIAALIVVYLIASLPFVFRKR